MAAGNTTACITPTCKKLIPGPNDDLLIKTLQSLISDHPVRLVWVGEEWYRISGVVDAEGKRVAHDLIECGRNLQTLIGARKRTKADRDTAIRAIHVFGRANLPLLRKLHADPNR